MEWYQYVAPAVLTPLSFWLWWRYYGGDILLVLTAWLLPILYAYIVPGIGTNGCFSSALTATRRLRR